MGLSGNWRCLEFDAHVHVSVSMPVLHGPSRTISFAPCREVNACGDHAPGLLGV